MLLLSFQAKNCAHGIVCRVLFFILLLLLRICREVVVGFVAVLYPYTSTKLSAVVEIKINETHRLNKMTTTNSIPVRNTYIHTNRPANQMKIVHRERLCDQTRERREQQKNYCKKQNASLNILAP